MNRDDHRLIGQDVHFLDVLERASRVAPLDRPVLIIGERGSGKELISERIHRLSLRWDQPYITLNCAALPVNLIDSELFGNEAGAYTGATRSRAGLFEEADGGSIFLDEIATLSAQAQEKLLRVIEYGVLQRLGSTKQITVDVRVIAATNEDLPTLANEGRFRHDLLDRLSFEVLTIPPLRQRKDDILPLAEHFAQRMALDLGRTMAPQLSPQAQEKFLAHPWPGNVRELKNVIERAVYQCPKDAQAIDHIVFDPFESPWRPQKDASDSTLPERDPTSEAASNMAANMTAKNITDDANDLSFKERVARFEQQLLTEALKKERYNQSKAAKRLDLTYDQFRHALRKHGLL